MNGVPQVYPLTYTGFREECETMLQPNKEEEKSITSRVVDTAVDIAIETTLEEPCCLAMCIDCCCDVASLSSLLMMTQKLELS
ncbi:unnamed protein product [Ceratitis capitata]|uniref:(Mediterranean fruit fly) hypothetical protein n=1 Tax=Ceratitis capitata TaxID=7213 RepID=A0A811VC27_CERCA|nr:unnamed protein product [Ceratitis capitata]